MSIVDTGVGNNGIWIRRIGYKGIRGRSEYDRCLEIVDTTGVSNVQLCDDNTVTFEFKSDTKSDKTFQFDATSDAVQFYDNVVSELTK